jgi:hypothetical protein
MLRWRLWLAIYARVLFPLTKPIRPVSASFADFDRIIALPVCSLHLSQCIESFQDAVRQLSLAASQAP